MKLSDNLEEIKSLKQWLAHKDKRPIFPSSYNDKNGLMTFDQAERVCQNNNLSGLGFSFFGSDICGIDIDHAIDKETGVVETWADLLIRAFDTYTERSISGTGFHILFRAPQTPRMIEDTYNIKGMTERGQLIYSTPAEDKAIPKEQRKHIEFYSGDKYFTLSGDVYHDKPIEDRTEKLGQFLSFIQWKSAHEERSRVIRGNETLKEELKSHIFDYMQLIGMREDRKAGREKYICPLCGSGSRGGRDSDGAFQFYPETNTFFCFSCRKGGDLFNLIEEHEKTDFRGAWKRALELFKPEEIDKAQTAPENADQARIQALDKRLQSNESLLTVEKMISSFEGDTGEYIEIDDFEKTSEKLRLRQHDSLVIGADTGGGKSSLALNWILSLSKKYPIIYFNLEMSSIVVYKRLVSIHADFELDLLDSYKNMDDRTRADVKKAMQEITSREPIRIFNDVRKVDEIRKVCHDLSREKHSIVFIDHMLLTEMTGFNGNYEKFTAISQELRKIALDENITMILLCQLNREGKKQDKHGVTYEPTLSSLKESGGIENDSTHVVFLYQATKNSGLELLIRKNRNGENGANILIDYKKSTQKMKELKIDDFKAVADDLEKKMKSKAQKMSPTDSQSLLDDLDNI